METKVLLMFPYSGFKKGEQRQEIFWSLVEIAKHVDARPAVVLNRDTERRGRCEAFLNDARTSHDVEILRTWSVDTCQMWLAGWGHVIDQTPTCERVVLLPGDLDAIRDQRRFFANLKGFLEAGRADIVIGDFTSESRYSSKELIDTYGTYPLLANWFDEVSRAIKGLPLSKPRSEFLNMRVEVLQELLGYRKFAYEQTLNMVVRSWDFGMSRWKYNISVHLLGELQDDKSLRQYRDTLDQIERTERLLRLLWRELREPQQTSDAVQDNAKYIEFIDEYHTKDMRSGAIRDSARTTIRTLLGA